MTDIFEKSPLESSGFCIIGIIGSYVSNDWPDWSIKLCCIFDNCIAPKREGRYTVQLCVINNGSNLMSITWSFILMASLTCVHNLWVKVSSYMSTKVKAAVNIAHKFLDSLPMCCYLVVLGSKLVCLVWQSRTQNFPWYVSQCPQVFQVIGNNIRMLVAKVVTSTVPYHSSAKCIPYF